MKKWLALIALAVPLAFVAGCEPWPENDDDVEIEFINRSDETVTVIPEARSGWSGFKLAPEQRKKLYDVYDVFFSYEPRYRVEVGKNDGGRVVFVNSGTAIETGGD